MGKGLVKLLILLALVPLPALLAQSKDQPDSGFGPMDTSAPATPPDQIVKQFAAKESEFRALWATTPTSVTCAYRPSTMTAR